MKNSSIFIVNFYTHSRIRIVDFKQGMRAHSNNNFSLDLHVQLNDRTYKHIELNIKYIDMGDTYVCKFYA